MLPLFCSFFLQFFWFVYRFFRLYQIENNQSANIGIYSVGEKPTTFFPGSKTPFLDIYGEVAVDFDFGHPEIFDGSHKSPVIDNSFVLRSQNRNTDGMYL